MGKITAAAITLIAAAVVAVTAVMAVKNKDCKQK